jgi:hypothetical protein
VVGVFEKQAILPLVEEAKDGAPGVLLSASMRAYKFLNQQYGLKSLYERRLRRTRVTELNDPFELRPYDLADAKVRWAVHQTRAYIAESFGLLCFSADWHDPVIWAHYSDKHRGLCLGFEMPPEVEKAQSRKVDYISAPIPFPADLLRWSVEQQLPVVEKMIFTKYSNWEYEHEIRTWTDLEEEFFEFCDVLKLVEVFIGAESQLPRGEVTRALGSLAANVEVNKVRAANDAFQIVGEAAQ